MHRAEPTPSHTLLLPPSSPRFCCRQLLLPRTMAAAATRHLHVHRAELHRAHAPPLDVAHKVVHGGEGRACAPTPTRARSRAGRQSDRKRIAEVDPRRGTRAGGTGALTAMGDARPSDDSKPSDDSDPAAGRKSQPNRNARPVQRPPPTHCRARPVCRRGARTRDSRPPSDGLSGPPRRRCRASHTGARRRR